MAAAHPPPVGVLIVRVWLDGEPAQTRMRITFSPDISRSSREMHGATNAEDVCEWVRKWLRTFTEETQDRGLH